MKINNNQQKFKYIFYYIVSLLIIIFVLFLFKYILIFPEINLAQISRIEASIIHKYGKKFGINRNLKIGDKGLDVKLLQYILNKEIEDKKLQLTGIFGEKTKEKLIKFQKKYNLEPTGFVDERTLIKLNEIYLMMLCPLPKKDYPDYLLYPVSKNNPLPFDYVPNDLVNITNKVFSDGIVCLRKEAAEALINMLNDAEREGLKIIVVSGFRRSEIQQYLYLNFIRIYGRKAMDVIARAGHSEHQLGTAVDLDSYNTRTSLEKYFENTKEGRWLMENSWKYGFIMSYPKGKKKITGYDYEPWHFRYVGREHAQAIKDKNITLIEYLKQLEVVNK